MGLRMLGESKDRPQDDFESKKKVAYPYLRMKTKKAPDGEEIEDAFTARIHFLSDWGDDLVWGRFHKVPTKTRDGGEYGKETFCINSNGGPLICPFCQIGSTEIERTFLRCFFYVYVYYIAHKMQGFDEWEKTENSCFSEPINSINVLQMNLIDASTILWKEVDVNYRKNGTLKNMDYYWQRYGCGVKTEYHLIPCGDSKMPLEKFAEMEKSLPSLESLVCKAKKLRKKKEAEG